MPLLWALLLRENTFQEASDSPSSQGLTSLFALHHYNYYHGKGKQIIHQNSINDHNPQTKIELDKGFKKLSWSPESKLKLWTISAAFNLSKAENPYIRSWNNKFKLKDWALLLSFQGVRVLLTSDQNKIQTKNKSVPFPS